MDWRCSDAGALAPNQSTLLSKPFTLELAMITTTQISILSLLIIPISLSLFHFKPTHNRPQFSSPHNQTLTLTPPPERSDHQDPQITRKNYIVRFLHYKRAEDHIIYLQDNVKLGGWEWVERRNPAARFPTDFGVVAIEDSARAAVVEELGKLEVVKDVSADFSYQRSLLGKKMDRVGAFVDGKKRPGKIFTVMSFSEGENYVAAVTGNKSISWKRHLLMQMCFGRKGILVQKSKWPYLTLVFKQNTHIFVISRSGQIGPMKIP